MASCSGTVTESEKNIVNDSANSTCASDFSQNSCDFKDAYYRELKKIYDTEKTKAVKRPWTKDKVFEVIRHVKRAKVSIESGARRTPAEYYWYKKYDVMNIGDVDYLILKKDSDESPTVCIIPLEEYYDILADVHRDCGHGGRDKIQYQLKDRFIIVRKAIDLFVTLCPICESKRSNLPRRSIVSKPITSQDFNERGQVDLIDLQSIPDGEFKWLLNYQDNNTKFVHLRPLVSNDASEVAPELLKIFLEFGAPHSLQSNNVESTTNILKEIKKLWPECKTIQGPPRHPQTQSSVEHINQDVENMLHTWIDNNSTKWSMGCFFVQYNKNTTFHRILGRSPFHARFGGDPKSDDLQSSISV